MHQLPAPVAPSVTARVAVSRTPALSCIARPAPPKKASLRASFGALLEPLKEKTLEPCLGGSGSPAAYEVRSHLGRDTGGIFGPLHEISCPTGL